MSKELFDTKKASPEILDYMLEFLSDHSGIATGELGRETDFVKDEILDSFGILSFIMSLESEFGVKFTVAELANPRLRIVEVLANLVHSKRIGNQASK